MINYFKINNLHSFNDLKLKGDTPIPPSFLNEEEEYSIEFNCFYVKRNKDDKTPIEQFSFIQSKIMNELSKQNTKLTYNKDDNYYHLVKNFSINIIELNTISAKYSIKFIVYRFKQLFSEDTIINIDINKNENTKSFTIQNKGIYCLPTFIFKTKETITNTTLIINIDGVEIIFNNLIPNKTIYIDFNLKECYTDNSLLNNNMNRGFFKLSNDIIRITLNTESLDSIKYKTNSKCI